MMISRASTILLLLATGAAGVQHLGAAPPRFNETDAARVMAVNAATLCPSTLLAAWNCSRCTPRNLFAAAAGGDLAVMEASKNNLLALVGASPSERTLFVAVRGTLDASLEDWLLDAEFWQKPFAIPGAEAYADARVHAGFLDAWGLLRPQVFAALNASLSNPRHAGYRLVLTGHSMGASVAALMAAELLAGASVSKGTTPPALPPKMPVYVYTFGQPRTGNAHFGAALAGAAATRPLAGGGTLWRVVNVADPVPHLPLKNSLGVNYWHVPREVWLKKAAALAPFAVCDGSGEDPRCSDSLGPLALRPKDHTSYFGLNAGPCAA